MERETRIPDETTPDLLAITPALAIWGLFHRRGNVFGRSLFRLIRLSRNQISSLVLRTTMTEVIHYRCNLLRPQGD
ncbi:hypothetical protein BS47DRAFT_1140085 [Hydnum rufescens UP504]|uniref:Uncharacterized protein n=1 Tax=Hydnum rufescens UP504 TaxID=1448309 RepID=A0A9P6DVK3_9AGAM|nr:hypothetical protein BS47DRAFT_1140085 [Hydnum rufescens UP504]